MNVDDSVDDESIDSHQVAAFFSSFIALFSPTERAVWPERTKRNLRRSGDGASGHCTANGANHELENFVFHIDGQTN